jgi:hypothetical protein
MNCCYCPLSCGSVPKVTHPRVTVPIASLRPARVLETRSVHKLLRSRRNIIIHQFTMPPGTVKYQKSATQLPIHARTALIIVEHSPCSSACQQLNCVRASAAADPSQAYATSPLETRRPRVDSEFSNRFVVALQDVLIIIGTLTYVIVTHEIDYSESQAFAERFRNLNSFSCNGKL